eukprot:765455-Hanusia_phi.AAC.5
MGEATGGREREREGGREGEEKGREIKANVEDAAGGRQERPSRFRSPLTTPARVDLVVEDAMIAKKISKGKKKKVTNAFTAEEGD